MRLPAVLVVSTTAMPANNTINSTCSERFDTDSALSSRRATNTGFGRCRTSSVRSHQSRIEAYLTRRDGLAVVAAVDRLAEQAALLRRRRLVVGAERVMAVVPRSGHAEDEDREADRADHEQHLLLRMDVQGQAATAVRSSSGRKNCPV